MKARNLESNRERKEKTKQNDKRDVCGFPSKAMAIVYTHRAFEQQITKSSPIYCHRKSRTRAMTYFVFASGAQNSTKTFMPTNRKKMSFCANIKL